MKQTVFVGKVFLVFGYCLLSVKGDLTSIVDVCCSLGTDWASSNVRCDDFDGVLPDLMTDEEIMCNRVIEVCCMKSKQDEMCSIGVQDAQDGNRCAVRWDLLGAVSYTECCECCHMGRNVRKMGMACALPSIGNPCDATFMECCQDPSGVSTTEKPNTDGGSANNITGMDECTLFGATQLCSQICIDTSDAYRCDCHPGYKLAVDGKTCYRDNNRDRDCPPGFAYNTISSQCDDIDECVIGTHSCQSTNEICRNNRGSYYCSCDDGFHRNRTTQMCDDIDECARRMDTCTSSQRCENTIGSFACRRITPCGTGWTLNEETQQCTDQNECEENTHNCGSGYECYNIEGSFRCNPKRCPDGMRFNSGSGQCEEVGCPPGFRADNSALCVDINECESRQNSCEEYQICKNNYGSYRCEDPVNCRPGFEVGSDGQTCTDIDECTTGKHDCRGGAECINRQGSYVCSCPRGFSRKRGRCEDKDECQYRNVCPSNSVCENTRGSFRCNCDAGFEQTGSQRCNDINECNDRNMCTQGCTNLVGSYVCTCDPGYQLASDGHTCLDIDECRIFSGPGVCAGECINTPGSYKCSCPTGWRIMGNDRSCQDINECVERTDRCGSSEDVMCFNTRGSHKCPRVSCPSGFSRSALGPRRNSVRCKRLSFTCRSGDQECITAPLSLSYNFLTFPTNVKIPTDIFSMSGPPSVQKRFNWYLNVTSSYTGPSGVNPVRRQNFDLRIGRNGAVVALLNKIDGPQDVELTLTMEITDIYSGYTGHAISKIYLYVTSDKIM